MYCGSGATDRPSYPRDNIGTKSGWGELGDILSVVPKRGDFGGQRLIALVATLSADTKTLTLCTTYYPEVGSVAGRVGQVRCVGTQAYGAKNAPCRSATPLAFEVLLSSVAFPFCKLWH